jgi:bifunctional UDP-N-acetylglucosamine pyrophosphorylase/glucosamine-1-phosphate N-acetyltransferase
MAAIDVVIMAAGKGTRMKSSMPKVLHRLGGRALVQHVIDSAHQLQARHIIAITGHGADQVEAALAGQAGLLFARQMPQLGTGHAVQMAAPALDDAQAVTLILYGDVVGYGVRCLHFLECLCTIAYELADFRRRSKQHPIVPRRTRCKSLRR